MHWRAKRIGMLITLILDRRKILFKPVVFGFTILIAIGEPNYDPKLYLTIRTFLFTGYTYEPPCLRKDPL